jgi:hypothetical protein
MTGQVMVRVTPFTAWIHDTTMPDPVPADLDLGPSFDGMLFSASECRTANLGGVYADCRAADSR